MSAEYPGIQTTPAWHGIEKPDVIPPGFSADIRFSDFGTGDISMTKMGEDQLIGSDHDYAACIAATGRCTRWDIAMANPMVRAIRAVADSIELVQTCSACPEQYDAQFEGENIAYLRLRHGIFTVEMGGPWGPLIYAAEPEGGGIFNPGERDRYLRNARWSIAVAMWPEWKWDGGAS